MKTVTSSVPSLPTLPLVLSLLMMIGLVPLLLHPAVPDLLRMVTGFTHLGVRNLGYFAHIGAYFGTTFAVLVVLRPVEMRTIGLITVALLLHGTATELSQHYIPARDCDPWDLACNVLSVCVATLLWAAIVVRMPRTE